MIFYREEHIEENVRALFGPRNWAMRERTPREVAGAGHGLDTLPKLDSPDHAGRLRTRLTAADVTRRAPAKPLILKDPPFVHDVLFFDFGLLPPILDAVAREGYDTPTPLQSQAGGRPIPLRLLRADRRAA